MHVTVESRSQLQYAKPMGQMSANICPVFTCPNSKKNCNLIQAATSLEQNDDIASNLQSSKDEFDRRTSILQLSCNQIDRRTSILQAKWLQDN